MENRISKKLVTFQFPFTLDEIDEECPAGDYTIETEDQDLDGANFTAHKCVETIMVIRPAPRSGKPTKYIEIDAAGLEAALSADKARGDAESKKASAGTGTTDEAQTDPFSALGGR
ncbi:hypothetical protein WNY37_00930 [Henriciella sp. AS95]|uniref:hypothetical protein n=1 Tax=Henriciella sp. AS95 TaxID=3135782 RepID=UPI003179653B